MLDVNRRQHAFMKIGGLASTIGIAAEDMLDYGQPDDQEATMILAGYAIGTGRNFVKRSDIPDLRSRLEEELAKMAHTVGRTEKEREDTSNLGKQITHELDEHRAAQGLEWRRFYVSVDEEWKSLRKSFEEHLKLDAPATYWKSRARWTFWAAMVSLGAFAALAVAFIWVVTWRSPLGNLSNGQRGIFTTQ